MVQSHHDSFVKYCSSQQGSKVQGSSQPIGSVELLLPGEAGSDTIRLVHFECERGFVQAPDRTGNESVAGHPPARDFQ